MQKFIRIARKYALQHEYERQLEFRLCAVIVKGGNIVSIGYNTHTTNSFVEHYANIARGFGRDYCLSAHAEMKAVLKAREKIDLKGSKIYVVRILASGELAMARPCIICQHVLYSYGLKKAYYSITSTEYGIMKIIEPKLYPEDFSHEKCTYHCNH